MRVSAMVTWAAGEAEDPRPVRIRRRWFPWPSRSVVLGPGSIWTTPIRLVPSPEGWTLHQPSPKHLQDELQHIEQYRTRGRWWVWWNKLVRPSVVENPVHEGDATPFPVWRLVVTT